MITSQDERVLRAVAAAKPGRAATSSDVIEHTLARAVLTLLEERKAPPAKRNAREEAEREREVSQRAGQGYQP